MSETAEKEGKPFEASDNAANDERQQQYAEGFEPITIKPIETAAKKYQKARDSRQEMLVEELILKEKLRAVMKEHKGDLPTRQTPEGHEEIFYPLPNGLQSVITPTQEDVKVKKMPKAKTDDSE